MLKSHPYQALIVDSDPGVHAELSEILKKRHWEYVSCTHAAEAGALLEKGPVELLLCDPQSSKAMQREIMGPHLGPLMVVMAAFASFDDAVQALESGVWDYLPKPFGDAQFGMLLAKAEFLLDLRRENRNLRLSHDYFRGLSSAASLAAQDFVVKVAPTDETVLLTGETGTGKSELAVAIHTQSRRANRPLVTLVCSTLAESLLESELFGHAKGAFTGAIAARKGKLQIAEGGTLFLDEVGELSLSAQARLLRFLNDKVVEAVGSNEQVIVNSRIIAATNRDLKTMVHEGKFREDLYFRLNMLELKLAPLRERKDEIMVLARRYLDEACLLRSMPAWEISAAARQALETYRWPGNLRELRHAIERAVILGIPPQLELHELPEAVRILPAGNVDKLVDGRLEVVERIQIAKVLASGVSQEEAAEILGISTATLWRKRKEYKLP